MIQKLKFIKQLCGRALRSFLMPKGADSGVGFPDYRPRWENRRYPFGPKFELEIPTYYREGFKNEIA